jgi:tRNA G10  N-methylase Trm11
LQEALLMGYKVVGTDLEPRMIEYTMKNLDWLKAKYNLENAQYNLEQGDATSYGWPLDISAVVSEVYLGRPLAKIPASEELI